MAISITFTALSREDKTLTHSARTNDVEIAIRRAIDRHYGKSSYFWRDSGLPSNERTRYGQIMRPCSSGGSTSVTNRIRIDIE